MSSSGTEIPTLDELARLEAAATPGPWLAKRHGEDRCDGITPAHNHPADVSCYDAEDDEALGECPARREIVTTDSGYYGPKWADAALIAAARNALPGLLKIARAVAEMPERGSDGYQCQFCYVTMGRKPHVEGCAWVLARKLTGGAP